MSTILGHSPDPTPDVFGYWARLPTETIGATGRAASTLLDQWPRTLSRGLHRKPECGRLVHPHVHGHAGCAGIPAESPHLSFSKTASRNCPRWCALATAR